MADDSITITLSGKDDVDWIRNKISSGSFADAGAVVAMSIETLREEEESLELWLRDTVGPRYDRYHSDPSSAMSGEQMQSTDR